MFYFLPVGCSGTRNLVLYAFEHVSCLVTKASYLFYLPAPDYETLGHRHVWNHSLTSGPSCLPA